MAIIAGITGTIGGFIVLGLLSGDIVYNYNVITIIVLTMVSSIYLVSIGASFYFCEKL